MVDDREEAPEFRDWPPDAPPPLDPYFEDPYNPDPYR